MDLMNINDPCVKLPLTTAGGSAVIAIDKKDEFISVYNPAETVTYVKAGGSATVATATDTWIPPKQTLVFAKGNETHLAGLNADEDVTLLIQTGGGM